MKITRWLVLLFSPAVLACCVQVVSGQGRMAPKPPPCLQRVDDSVRADRAHAQQLRLQDPCSLINVDAAAKLGKIKYIGTESKAEWCDVIYDVPKKAPTAQDSMADPDYVPGLVAKISVGGITTDDDGKGEQVRPMDDRCFDGLRSGHQYSWGPERIMFEIEISGQIRPGCEELRTVVDASRATLSHPKLRADSPFQPHTKLVGMDPCQILDTATGDEPLKILTPLIRSTATTSSRETKTPRGAATCSTGTGSCRTCLPGNIRTPNSRRWKGCPWRFDPKGAAAWAAWCLRMWVSTTWPGAPIRSRGSHGSTPSLSRASNRPRAVPQRAISQNNWSTSTAHHERDDELTTENINRDEITFASHESSCARGVCAHERMHHYDDRNSRYRARSAAASVISKRPRRDRTGDAGAH